MMTIVLLVLAVLVAGYLWGAWASATVILRPRRWTLAEAAEVVGHATPADFGRDFSDLEIRHGDVALRGWLVRAQPPTSRTVILIHRVGENRVGMLSYLPMLEGLGANVALLDLRTHGESDGRVLTSGVREREDVKALIDWLCRHGLAEAGQVALVGKSLGGAIALQTAAVDDRVGAVVADGVYARLRSTIHRFARQLFAPGIVTAPLAVWFAERRAGFSVREASPITVADRVRCPVLLICGEVDRLAPPAGARELAAALGGPAELWIVPRAGHCQADRVEAEAYARRVRRFLERHLAAHAARSTFAP